MFVAEESLLWFCWLVWVCGGIERAGVPFSGLKGVLVELAMYIGFRRGSVMCNCVGREVF